jgi:hypothetical protein
VRIVLGIVSVCAVVVGASWARAMTGAGQESFAARNAEWMRDHGLGFLVDRVEQYQVSHDQPKDGGTPVRALAAVATTTTSPAAPLWLPSPMPTSALSPFPGEGVWVPAGPVGRDGVAGVYTTRVRPNARKTSLVVFVARIDPARAAVRLVPGTQLPGGSWSHPPDVTAAECSTAILATNGGFRFDQSGGGWYADRHQAPNAPLRIGAASLVTFADGRVTVGVWGRDVGPADLASIAQVRQNLTLLVDHGQVDPHIDDAPKWGARLRNSLFIWRSGYGITADGVLVYVGGPGLTPRDLAERLIDAGAIRGMEGDINPEWVAANLIDHTGACHGTKALDAPPAQGGQQSSGQRYLSADTRDFVEVLARRTH